jgi:hypothetical protein
MGAEIMSGETLTIGSLIFKKGTPELTQLHALNELAVVLEVNKSELKDGIVPGDASAGLGPGLWEKWSFQSLNWQSHVERDGIETFLSKRKKNIQKFVCSIHHLNDPDEINYTGELQ